MNCAFAHRAGRNGEFHEPRRLLIERTILAGFGNLLPRLAEFGIPLNEVLVRFGWFGQTFAHG